VANIASSAKRNRQSIKRRHRNKHFRSAVKTATRRLREALDTKDAAKIQTAFREAESTIGRARSKGVLHASNASRRVARLAIAVAKVTGSKRAAAQ
jgi:small subunit ribosomal protein S20